MKTRFARTSPCTVLVLLVLSLFVRSSLADVIINLDATQLPAGPLSTWTNAGSLPGNFTSAGTIVPTVTNIAGVNAISFLTNNGVNGTHYVGPATPSFITGTNSRSIEAWVYDPSAQPEETVFGWSRRGGGPDGSNVSFNHGTDAAFGAVGHWGAGPDIGWSNQIAFNAWSYIAYTWDPTSRVTRVYKDGVLVNSEANISLNTHLLDSTGTNALRFRVARQNEANGNPSPTGVGEIFIAKIRVHDIALPAVAIQAAYSRERCAFTNDMLCLDDDGDGIPNFYELRFPGCLDPTNNADGTNDCDSDGLTNFQEYQNGTLANVADSDGDSLSDSAEVNRLDGGVAAPTDPLLPDTDSDGIYDPFETDTGTFVSLTNTGTDPLRRDTDGDGLPERYEIQFLSCLNPSAADASLDCDGDGLTNLQEFQLGTLPNNADSDGDGLSDSAEVNRLDGGVAAPTNPLRPDSDLDGLSDGVETDTGVYVSQTNTGTDPLKRDSDLDAYSDIHEIVRGSNPNDPLSKPNLTDPALTPVVNLDATTLGLGPLAVWTNNGALGGTFNAGGAPPSVTDLQGVRGVTLNGVTSGSHFFNGPGAPNFLVGTNNRTIEAWIFNPDATPEETIFAWSRRGGPNGSNLSFNHGTDAAFGAVGHWGGGPDISWGNSPTGGIAIGRWTFVAYTYNPTNTFGTTISNLMTVYKDGVQANAEISIPPLNTAEFDSAGRRLPFRVGAQSEANGAVTPNLRGGMTIARIRVYEVTRDAVTISNTFIAEADAFGVVDTDADLLPTWYERLYPACLNPTNSADATLDCDGDGLTNLQEFQAGSAPDNADTDGDGASDGAEVNRMAGGSPAPTNPLRADTDQDGLSDSVETGTGTVGGPNDSGSNPLAVDSDGDGFADGQEIFHQSDPNNVLLTPDFDFTDPLAIINLDATQLALGALGTWTNNGPLGGFFRAGGDLPVVSSVQGVHGVTFDGNNDFYNGPVVPVFLTSSNSHSIEAWIYNPVAADEETIFGWSRRGGPDGSNLSFNHGLNPVYGAVGHWGASDIGWAGNVETGRWTHVAYTYDRVTKNVKVYSDGILANSATNISLNLHALDGSSSSNQLPFRVAAQTESGGSASVGLQGSMTIGRIRVYDEALTEGDIAAHFDAEFGIFVLPALSISLDRTAGVATITWSGLPGKTYAVESTSDFNSWTVRATAVTTGVFVDDTVDMNEQRFYRIREE